MKYVLTIVLLCIIASMSFAQSPTAQQKTATPLEKLLNPDGTINTKSGYIGTLDPTGYRMIEDPDGTPRFIRSKENITSSADDVNWDDRFGYSESGGSIFAIAINGSDVYCGGSFLQLENITLNHIAKWDGSNWIALGAGTNGPVHAIAVSGSAVYVGGYFTTAGGVSAKNIAQWDGSNWSALGSGIDTSGVMFYDAAVFTLAVSGTDLYVGGQFNMAGGVASLSIAKWNGTNWSSLNSGSDYAVVRAIATMGTDLYVGGYFTAIGGVPAKCIAKWNGSTWSALGSGMDYYQWINALAVIGTDLFAGGGFTSAGGVSANYIAKWNGTNWSAFSTGMNANVYALTVSGTDLYAGGPFTIAGGVNALHIAKWDGGNWSSVGLGLGPFDGPYGGGNVSDLAVNGTDLYAIGGFATAGNSVNVQGFARWNGSDWFPVMQTNNGRGIDSYVRAIVTSGTNVYVGGEFTRVAITGAFDSGIPMNRIARWDGTNWNPLGWGIEFPGFQVYAVAVSGSDVYAGGYFAQAGGVLASNIAKWDGLQWTALGTGANSNVYAIKVIGTDIYVGGDFTSAGDIAGTNYIAKWDGSNWSALGTGMDGIVYAIDTLGGYLYAGGLFTNAGGNPASYIAKWDGSNWSAVGTGMNDFVRCMTTSASEIYIGGGFTTAGGDSANNIVKWDGTTWTPLGLGTNGWVRSVSLNGSDLYAGGDFTTAGVVSASYIAKWDGSNWSALGSGVNQRVRAVCATENLLYVGGEFTIAGNKDSHNFGIWNTNTIPQAYSVSEGWNMLSAPLHTEDYLKSSIYPTAVSPAFTYQGSYIINDTLQSGVGYWVKFNSPQTVSYAGIPIDNDTIEVTDKWNMVGSISRPVAVSNITSEPGGIVTSQFFAYAGTYLSSDSIMPGHGYWVKTNQAGKLILSNSTSIQHQNKIQIIHTNELPPPGPGEGVSSTLLEMPESFGLQQNYPNPFNPTTIIGYQLPVSSWVTIKIYNMLGQEVTTLVDGLQEVGYKTVELDASNLPSGIYSYRLSAGTFTDVKKMILLK